MENLSLQELIQALIELEKKYPNDFDLGKEIRKFIIQLNTK